MTETRPAPIALPALSARPRLGFDLDMTLLDMRTATARALRGVNATLGTAVDVDAVIADLGAPFRAQLGRWIDDDRLDLALRTFLKIFVTECLPLVVPLPGAGELLAAVRRRDGWIVVITGRRARVARACLRRCELNVDAVVGGVTGTAKTPAIIGHRVDAFVGDHPLDMLAARTAGVPGIAVPAAPHLAPALLEAGATAVVSSLDELARWLSQDNAQPLQSENPKPKDQFS